MKIIGIELRVGIQGAIGIKKEIAVFPVEFHYPSIPGQFARPYAEITIHTSAGDVTEQFALPQDGSNTINSPEEALNFIQRQAGE